MYQTSTVTDMCQRIRSQIVPFGGIPPDLKTFQVGWTTARLTFEQITDALRPQILNDLLYFKKMARQYIADLLQQGWLRLWQALHENCTMLAEMTCRDAADFVCNRCGATTMRDYSRRYASYHSLSRWNEPDAELYEDNITEIVIGSSVKSTGQGRHALFTRTVDRMIDIEAAIRDVALWCEDDIRKLAALYYLTTSVSQLDAGQIAGFPVVEYKQGRKRCRGIQYWTRIVLQQLKIAFASYEPIEPNRNAWRDQLKDGKTEPIQYLAEKYIDDEVKLIALYVLTTRVARETAVNELGIDDSKLWYATKQVRNELRYIYASRSPKIA